MKCLNFLLLIFFVVFCISCKESTEPNNNDLPPPGFQEYIPWPSLAESSWPRDHGDAQSTGRNKYPGPITGSVGWSIDTVSLNCGISMGEDASIYFSTCQYDYKSRLYKVSLQGEIIWSFDTGKTISNNTTPMVTNDGTIIASNGLGGIIFAINSDGSLKWRYDIKEWIQHRGINIGKDGTIYVVDVKKTLYAINQTGNLLWTLSLEDVNNHGCQGISFSPDGNTLYIRGMYTALIAVDINTKSIKWTFGDKEMSGGSTPVVNSDGQVFILGIPLESDGLQASLTALNSTGEIEWRYFFGELKDVVTYYAPTIDKQGNIFFAHDSLYALNYLGDLNWKLDIPSWPLGALTCDMNDIVYIPVSPDWKKAQVLAYDTAGNFIWESELMNGTCGESMALGNGYLVLPTHWSESLYMIE